MRDMTESAEGSLLDMNDIDVLYNKMDSKPKIYQSVTKMRDEYL